QPFLGRATRPAAQQREPPDGTAPARRRKWIEHLASADRSQRRLIAHNETVAVQSADHAVQHQLYESSPTWLQVLLFEQCDAPHRFARAQMKVHWRPMRERPTLGLQQCELCIDALCGSVYGSSEYPVTALYTALVEAAFPHQIQRAALPCIAHGRRQVLRVD